MDSEGFSLAEALQSGIELRFNLSELVFIPSIPYDSKEISEANGNLWELHELNPSDQIISIKKKP
jgi:hypothetical protein